MANREYTPNDVKYSLLERWAANTFGTLNYISFKLTGEPEPDADDQMDNAEINIEYYVNKCFAGLAQRKHERRAKRAELVEAVKRYQPPSVDYIE